MRQCLSRGGTVERRSICLRQMLRAIACNASVCMRPLAASNRKCEGESSALFCLCPINSLSNIHISRSPCRWCMPTGLTGQKLNSCLEVTSCLPAAHNSCPNLTTKSAQIQAHKPWPQFGDRLLFCCCAAYSWPNVIANL